MTQSDKFYLIVKAAGVEELVSKLKGIPTAVGQMWNKNHNNPLFGVEAQRAARNGVTMLSDDAKSILLPNIIRTPTTENLARKILGHPNIIDDPAAADKAKGLVVNMINDSKLGGTGKAPKGSMFVGVNTNTPMAQLYGDKYKESLPSNFGKFIPETILNTSHGINPNLPKEEYIKQLTEANNKQFGEGQWLAKKRFGFNSKNLGGVVLPGGDLNEISRNGDNWISQAYRPIKKVYDPKLGGVFDDNTLVGGIKELLMNPKKTWKSVSPWNPKNYSPLEYRVHTANGKVINYASIERGGGAYRYLRSLLQPTRYHRRAEELAQKALDSTSKANRGGGYGMDIGIDTKGEPFMIEGNPTEGGSQGQVAASGYLTDMPFTQQAIAAAAKGELPNFVKLRRAGKTGVGLGTLGLGYQGLKGNTDEQSVA